MIQYIKKDYRNALIETEVLADNCVVISSMVGSNIETVIRSFDNYNILTNEFAIVELTRTLDPNSLWTFINRERIFYEHILNSHSYFPWFSIIRRIVNTSDSIFLFDLDVDPPTENLEKFSLLIYLFRSHAQMLAIDHQVFMVDHRY